MNITHNDIAMYGYIITSLFDRTYPNGTTLSQMETDAASSGWIRAILPSLEARKEMESFVDVSEVGM